MCPEQLEKKERSQVSIWFQAIRVFSLTASSIPVFLGAALALYHPGDGMWILLPAVYFAGLLFHAATNLISDYYDYQNEVDKNYTFGSSGVLVNGLLKPKQVFWAGWLLFGTGFALGVIFILFRGLPILILGSIGLVGGYLYTGKPFGYKYIGLGDFLVFILMGPLMVIGSYFCLTGTYNDYVFYISLPVGFLVMAILQGNNTRDLIHDLKAKITTFETILGPGGAKGFYYFSLSAAYLSVVIMVVLKILPLISLAVLVTLPLALKNFKKMAKANTNNPLELATMDVETAQLHFAFGLVLVISLVIYRFL